MDRRSAPTDRAPGPVRVVIIEDDEGTREGLATLINGAPGFTCVGTYRRIEDALPGMRSEVPDVVLLDIQLPGMRGSEGVRVIRERHPSCEVLMLTVYAEQERVFESICNGASGYLLKKTPATRLLQAIAEVRDGGAPMSPEIARQVIGLFRSTAPPASVDQRLTPQEVNLLRLLADGHSYNAAGNRLNISVNTVRNYIRSIYDKLHVHSRSAAVSKAAEPDYFLRRRNFFHVDW